MPSTVPLATGYHWNCWIVPAGTGYYNGVPGISKDNITVTTNLLTYADAENGTTNWTGQDCALSVNTSDKHAGNASFMAASRVNQYAGPRQDF